MALVALPVTLHAQIVEFGTEATLDIATWNIEWFGHSSNGPSNDDIQVQNVIDIVSGSGVDIWAVQEIANTNRFNEVLTALPDYWEGFLATDSGQQRIGYLYDSRVLGLRQSTHILQSFDYEFAGRPPLKAEFNVTLPDTAFVATFINVHMKAFSDRTSWERRTEAARRVKNHIDFTGLATQPVFFLGDFNDELAASTYNSQRSPYAVFIEDPDDYAMLTSPLEQSGGFSFQSGSFLDHIIASNEAEDMWVQGSTRVLTGLVTVNSFYARTSDHLPVMASFGPSTVTDVEQPEWDVLPDLVSAPWPNPSSGSVTFDYRGQDPTAEWVVVDVLGRTLSRGPAQRGLNTLEIDGTGLVFIRLHARDGVSSRPVVVTASR